PGQTPENLEAELSAHMERLKTEPVTDEELARAKNQIEAAFVYQDDSIHQRASLLARFELIGGFALKESFMAKIRAVTAAALTRAGAVYDPADRVGLANLTGAVLTRGTAKRTGPELDSAIEFVGGSLQAGAGRDGLTVSLTAQKKDMTLGLDLVSEVVLSPAL